MRFLNFVGVGAIVSLSLAAVPAVFSVVPAYAAEVNWKSIASIPSTRRWPNSPSWRPSIPTARSRSVTSAGPT